MNIDYDGNPNAIIQLKFKSKSVKIKLRKYCQICNSYTHSIEKFKYNAKSKNFKGTLKETKNVSKKNRNNF